MPLLNASPARPKPALSRTARGPVRYPDCSPGRVIEILPGPAQVIRTWDGIQADGNYGHGGTVQIDRQRKLVVSFDRYGIQVFDLDTTDLLFDYGRHIDDSNFECAGGQYRADLGIWFGTKQNVNSNVPWFMLDVDTLTMTKGVIGIGTGKLLSRGSILTPNHARRFFWIEGPYNRLHVKDLDSGVNTQIGTISYRAGGMTYLKAWDMLFLNQQNIAHAYYGPTDGDPGMHKTWTMPGFPGQAGSTIYAEGPIIDPVRQWLWYHNWDTGSSQWKLVALDRVTFTQEIELINPFIVILGKYLAGAGGYNAISRCAVFVDDWLVYGDNDDHTGPIYNWHEGLLHFYNILTHQYVRYQREDIFPGLPQGIGISGIAVQRLPKHLRIWARLQKGQTGDVGLRFAIFDVPCRTCAIPWHGDLDIF